MKSKISVFFSKIYKNFLTSIVDSPQKKIPQLIRRQNDTAMIKRSRRDVIVCDEKIRSALSTLNVSMYTLEGGDFINGRNVCNEGIIQILLLFTLQGKHFFVYILTQISKPQILEKMTIFWYFECAYCISEIKNYLIRSWKSGLRSARENLHFLRLNWLAKNFKCLLF